MTMTATGHGGEGGGGEGEAGHEHGEEACYRGPDHCVASSFKVCDTGSMFERAGGTLTSVSVLFGRD